MDRLVNGQQRSIQDPLHVFIGREAELSGLLAGLEDAIGGRGRLFLVEGEPGIGKTMLAEQLATRALERGVLAVWGRCWEGGGAPAYWPWTQILRFLLEEGPESGRDGRDADIAEVARLFPGLDEGSGEDAGSGLPAQSVAMRFRLFAAVASLLKRASSAQPLLIILDDLHAADPASLLLLRFVARDVRGQRMLLVATYRDVEAQRDVDVAEALGELVREGPSIRLPGMDRAEVRQFMRSLTGMTASDEELARIDEATRGNPLFIRELVHMAGTDGRLGWGGHPGVSAGVRAVIHQRLATVDANAIHVLSVAAIVGQDFEAHLVQQVSGPGLREVLRSLGQAERSELVMRVPGSATAFRFSHGLVREVLYDDLPVEVRRELHAKVGAALEDEYVGEPASRLAQLAYHYSEVTSREAAAKAVEYARQAGDQAMDSYAYEEATVQYRRALDALRLAEPDESLRCELYLGLGTAQARAGFYQEAKESFERAARIARGLQSPERLARAALGFGEPQVEGGLVDQQLLLLLQEALDALGPDDSALRARVLARFSLELTFSGDPRLRETLRESHSREALEMARRLGDLSTLALACRARWMALWGPDGLEERSALADEILRLARETGDREMELIGRSRRITCSIESGDLWTAEVDTAGHARLACELRMPYHEWTSATLRAGQALLEGSLGVAEELAEEARSMLPGRPNARLAHITQITAIRWEQGQLGGLRAVWQEVVERFAQAGFGRGWLALADAEDGNEDAARRGLHSMVEGIRDLPRGGLWLATLATASIVAAKLEDPGAAASVYPLLLPYAGRAIAVPMPHPVQCFGSASLYLALLAGTSSRWEEAEDYFESAIQANTRLGARALLARTRYEYARMLIRRGGTTGRERASMLLEQAESTARALGMSAMGKEIERVQESEVRPGFVPEQVAAPTVSQAGGGNLFRQEGDYRTVVFEGTLVRLRDSKGLRLLARLLSEPGREFHAVDLEAEENRESSDPPGSGRQSDPAELEIRPDLGDAGELLDSQAKVAYKTRLQELEAEMNEAEAWSDPERAARARQERDFLLSELARAVGLGGRDRKAASHSERARLNVTRAIKAALSNVDRHHPALGRHLHATVRTGTFCVYSPDPRVPVAWQV